MAIDIKSYLKKDAKRRDCPEVGVAKLAFRPKCRVVACHDREEDAVCQRFVAVATGRDRTLAQFFPVLQQPFFWDS